MEERGGEVPGEGPDGEVGAGEVLECGGLAAVASGEVEGGEKAGVGHFDAGIGGTDALVGGIDIRSVTPKRRSTSLRVAARLSRRRWPRVTRWVAPTSWK